MKKNTKKIIIAVSALCLALTTASCGDSEIESLKRQNADLSEKIKSEMSSDSKKDDTENKPAGKYIYEPVSEILRYNNDEKEISGYLLDDSEYLFAVEDMARILGLTVSIGENGEMAINGELNFDNASKSSAPANSGEVDERYTMGAISELLKKGDIKLVIPTAQPKKAKTSENKSSENKSSENTGLSRKKQSLKVTPAPGKSSNKPSGTDKNIDKPEPTPTPGLGIAYRNDNIIYEDFNKYMDVESRFYPRFNEIPNLSWANSDAKLIQSSNQNDNATYWYSIPESGIEALQNSYATLLSQFHYKYAGSSGGRHTYKLGSNEVSFGRENDIFMVSMKGAQNDIIDGGYVNGYKIANITNFGNNFNLHCNEEVMYNGDWVYSYSAEDVEKEDALERYTIDLKKKGYEYIGAENGRNYYSNGEFTVGTHTVDDNFYLSILKEEGE